MFLFLFLTSPSLLHLHLHLHCYSTSSLARSIEREREREREGMQYKNLGQSGLKVSQLSYGAFVSFGKRQGRRAPPPVLPDHGPGLPRARLEALRPRRLPPPRSSGGVPAPTTRGSPGST
ncbi:putative voltage-gated potassium channel subunit beta [Iris pallida]|uniref:Voltage-gated potassium channel subunit beta n=1 Tax=Iris pallida TaxID=29817 RepID=A0AAX6G9H4_IRIPA|nr:putative voltage-gated potassium channel subunit beta [Iris pallida]